MAVITPTYLSGYLGSVTVDTNALPTDGWSADHVVGTWDATNSTTGGAAFPERTIESMNGTCTVMWKVSAGAPPFAIGGVYAITLVTHATQSYSFNGLVTKLSPKVDNKGGVTYALSFESQGPITVPT